MKLKLTPKSRLIATIVISFSFFVAEIAVGFKTRSLALIADAFHYLNDLVGFIVAFSALTISERSTSPQDLSFGWQRARLLGAFFNGVFLLALGVSVFLQSIERFITLEIVNNPKLVLIMGCIGLALNIISAAFLHEHSHDHEDAQADAAEAGVELHTMDSQQTPHHVEHRHLTKMAEGPGRDLNMLGAFVHVLGDAVNNIGVIISAVVIWKATYPARYYADPGVSMGIAFMILLSALPLVKSSGTILLQSAPRGVDMDDVRHDLEKIPGIESVHELHIWRLDQQKAIASAHVLVSDQSISSFMEKARTASECLHAYGVHSVTLQPELSISSQASAEKAESEGKAGSGAGGAGAATAAAKATGAVTGDISNGVLQSVPVSVIRRRRADLDNCQIPCGAQCESLSCCKSP